MKLVLVLSLAVASFTVVAQTKWPGFMPQLKPTISTSPNKANLPADLKVVPPAADVPPERALWSGTWTGWACHDAVCETRLAVETVTREGADVVYVFADARQKGNPVRVAGKFSGSELQATLPSGGTITYRLRADGNMEFLFTQSAEQWAVGLLTKDK